MPQWFSTLALSVFFKNFSDALLFKKKLNFFSALQKIYYDEVDRPKCERILIVPENVDITCVIDLTENIRVLGTESGLYSYYEKNLLHIEGLDKVPNLILKYF